MGAGEEFFVDSSGEVRRFHVVQRAWFPERGADPNHGLAVIEMGVLLGLGTAYYWARPSLNRVDWDTPTLAERLSTQAVRFDNNTPPTNFVAHPFSGGLSYAAARLNDLTVPESALYSMITSAVWEYLLEFREKVSINDLIFTPAGGIPIGAFLFRMSDYLWSAAPEGSVANQAVGYAIGWPRVLHPRSTGPETAAGRMPRDSLRLSSAYAHRFRLGYEGSGVRTTDAGGATLHTVLASGELVAMAGFLRPGRFDKLFASDNFTELQGRVSFSESRLAEVDFRGSGTLVGGYSQSFRSAPGGPAGHGEMAGLSVGLRFVERSYADVRDLYASTHLLGASGGLWLGMGPLRARALGEARYDFAAVHSLAFGEYRSRHQEVQVKSVLAEQGYQFAFGPSLRLRVELAFSPVSLGGSIEVSRYHVVGGLDRRQEITTDVEASERVLEYGTFLALTPTELPLFLRGSADWTVRDSSLGDASAHRRDARFGVGGGLEF